MKKKKYNFRSLFLVDGPLHTKVKGTKKGKKGYNRKDKSWKNND
jgi:hypothetical protein